MSDVEKRFHRAIIDSSDMAKRECGYNPADFLRMVSVMGSVGAAKQLLATDKPSEGFTML